MKLHQNRLDRFSVIAKRLVDDHSAQLYKDQMTATREDVFNNHLHTLGKQLEHYATEFIRNCKVQNEQFKQDVWGTCNKYIDLFTKLNEPGKLPA